MKITKVEPLPNVLKFKNKEDFTNRIIQEVMVTCKKNSRFAKTNRTIFKLDEYKNNLILKNEKLDDLIEKSHKMKEELNDKINLLVEANNKFKNKLLEIIDK